MFAIKITFGLTKAPQDFKMLVNEDDTCMRHFTDKQYKLLNDVDKHLLSFFAVNFYLREYCRPMCSIHCTVYDNYIWILQDVAKSH